MDSQGRVENGTTQGQLPYRSPGIWSGAATPGEGRVVASRPSNSWSVSCLPLSNLDRTQPAVVLDPISDCLSSALLVLVAEVS